MYPDNDWYGHKQIFADYCGLSSPKAVYGSIRHGWSVHLPSERVGHQRAPFAPTFFWNQRHRDAAERNGVTNSLCVGAPFAYLVRLMWPEEPATSGTGTIVFPAHSFEGTTLEYSISEFVTSVTDTCPPPYTVSIFYQEFDQPYVNEYRRHGWRVVSFGTRGEPLFLYRQAAELAAHSHVVGNVVQTAILYGALLGKHVRVVGPEPRLSSAGPVHEPSTIEKVLSQQVEGGRRLFPELHDRGLHGSAARELGRAELGEDCMLTPDALCHVLGWDSPLRTGTARLVGRILDVRLGRASRKGQVSVH